MLLLMLTIHEHEASREGAGVHIYKLTQQQVRKQGQVDTYSIL